VLESVFLSLSVSGEDEGILWEDDCLMFLSVIGEGNSGISTILHSHVTIAGVVASTFFNGQNIDQGSSFCIILSLISSPIGKKLPYFFD